VGFCLGTEGLDGHRAPSLLPACWARCGWHRNHHVPSPALSASSVTDAITHTATYIGAPPAGHDVRQQGGMLHRSAPCNMLGKRASCELSHPECRSQQSARIMPRRARQECTPRVTSHNLSVGVVRVGLWMLGARLPVHPRDNEGEERGATTTLHLNHELTRTDLLRALVFFERGQGVQLVTGVNFEAASAIQVPPPPVSRRIRRPSHCRRPYVTYTSK
jgi:hypothetical protein